MLPQDAYIWQTIEAVMRRRAALAGFREVRTPVFEHTELFLRGVGDTTDIVQKEMYTFKDKGDRSITLKPEGTAGAVRAFLEGKLFADAEGKQELTPDDVILPMLVSTADLPQTGDTSNLALWTALLFISGGAAIGTTVVSRKKKVNR